ncbi:MAG: hypothetical protein OXC19_05595 [Bryobacterales bacterium]|nr:hypothetical protein [Bryobacterales bacterium]
MIWPQVIRIWQQVGDDALRQGYPVPRLPTELYDLLTDPLEQCSLADDPAYENELTELQGELDRWAAPGELVDVRP